MGKLMIGNEHTDLGRKYKKGFETGKSSNESALKKYKE